MRVGEAGACQAVSARSEPTCDLSCTGSGVDLCICGSAPLQPPLSGCARPAGLEFHGAVSGSDNGVVEDRSRLFCSLLSARAQRRRPPAGGSWRCGAAWVTVVFADQRLGGRPYGTGDATDVAPGVEITAAGAEVVNGQVPFSWPRTEVVALDVPDDCFPDTGLLADLRDSEAGLASCMCQGVTDIHPPPPVPVSPRSARGGRGGCNRPVGGLHPLARHLPAARGVGQGGDADQNATGLT